MPSPPKSQDIIAASMSADQGEVTMDDATAPDEGPVIVRPQQGPKAHITRLSYEIRAVLYKHLDFQSMASLSLTCTDFAVCLPPLLFTTDALQGGGHRNRACPRAIRHGGKINTLFYGRHRNDYASGLHLACASGNTYVVGKFLNAEADVNSKSSGFHFMFYLGLCAGSWEREDIHQLDCLLSEDIKECFWFPLLLPMLRRELQIIQVLKNANHGPFLAEAKRQPDADFKYGVTIYHAMALIDEDHYYGGIRNEVYEQLFYKPHNLGHIDVPTPITLMTALHVAVEASNPYIVDKLTQAGAFVEWRNIKGRTPLMEAVKLYQRSRSERRRGCLWTIIERLLESGANANRNYGEETPLLLAVDVLDLDHGMLQPTKKLIELLMRYGADFSLPDTFKQQAVIRIAHNIRMKGGNASLESLLTFVCERGADINTTERPVTGTTILFEFLKNYDKMDYRTIKLVKELGAEITEKEADGALCYWVQYPNMRRRNLGYNVFLWKHWFSQDAVNKAYSRVWAIQDRNAFNLLRLQRLHPTNGSELVWDSLQSTRRTLWQEAKRLDFDPKYHNDRGRTYLHHIVDKLTAPSSSYREWQAVEDARFFFERGTSTLWSDYSGRNAYGHLLYRTEGRKSFKKLREFLAEATDVERSRQVRDEHASRLSA